MRDKNYRQEENRKIIQSLCKLNLNPSYEPIKLLYKHLQNYLTSEERIKINISFPEIHKKIVGVLAVSDREETWIKLESIV